MAARYQLSVRAIAYMTEDGRLPYYKSATLYASIRLSVTRPCRRSGGLPNMKTTIRRSMRRKSGLSGDNQISPFGVKSIAENTVELSVDAGERLLTIEELAERLQYSAEWVRHQVRFRRIPVIAFNTRAWRFHWPTVLAALQNL
jgi:hypothetical protein